MDKSSFPKKYQEHITKVEHNKIRCLPCAGTVNEYIVTIDDGSIIGDSNRNKVMRKVKDYINALY